MQESRRYLAHMSSFIPNFVSIATRVSRGKIRLAAFNDSSPKTPYRRKNLRDVFYTRRVIANFVPNFIAMATGVGLGKMRLAAFNGPSPKNPYRRKNLADISYTRQVITMGYIVIFWIFFWINALNINFKFFNSQKAHPCARPRRLSHRT